MILPSISDYSSAIQTPGALLSNALQGMVPMEKAGRLVKYSGGFCVVFPCIMHSDKYAVRCWHTDVDRNRVQKISEELSSIDLPYFANFRYIDNAILTPLGPMPVVIMNWAEGLPIKEYIQKHLFEKQVLLNLAEEFKRMVQVLHAHRISHGDLQHGNILVKPEGGIMLVDYDSMYFPCLAGETDDIKGLIGYQHPGRWSNKYLTEKADYFSELVIYLSIKAFSEKPKWFDELRVADSETLLFTREDIKSGGKSLIFNQLLACPNLKLITNRLIAFLQESDINNLCPLEEAVVSVVDTIASKWKNGNGYTGASAQKHISVMTSTISSKWNK